MNMVLQANNFESALVRAPRIIVRDANKHVRQENITGSNLWLQYVTRQLRDAHDQIDLAKLDEVNKIFDDRLRQAFGKYAVNQVPQPAKLCLALVFNPAAQKVYMRASLEEGVHKPLKIKFPEPIQDALFKFCQVKADQQNNNEQLGVVKNAIDKQDGALEKLKYSGSSHVGKAVRQDEQLKELRGTQSRLFGNQKNISGSYKQVRGELKQLFEGVTHAAPQNQKLFYELAFGLVVNDIDALNIMNRRQSTHARPGTVYQRP